MCEFIVGDDVFQAIFYSTSIFKSAGLDEAMAQGATLGMGACNVMMTFVSLILIEKAGRKTLMIAGLCVMLITTTMILICLKVEVIYKWWWSNIVKQQMEHV